MLIGKKSVDKGWSVAYGVHEAQCACMGESRYRESSKTIEATLCISKVLKCGPTRSVWRATNMANTCRNKPNEDDEDIPSRRMCYSNATDSRSFDFRILSIILN